MQEEIELKNLSKSFGSGSEKIAILNNLNLSIKAEERCIVMGSSGSGKSTLLNLIAGLEKPDFGTIKVGQYIVDQLKEKQLDKYRNLKLGFIFQFHYLLEDCNALENVMVPALIRGISTKEARDAARTLIEEVGLSNREKHYPSTLSGGERQRVALARALINQPDVLLADEPTGSLDEKNAYKVKNIILSSIEKHKKTLILVSHDRGFLEMGTGYYLEGGTLLKI